MNSSIARRTLPRLLAATDLPARCPRCGAPTRSESIGIRAILEDGRTIGGGCGYGSIPGGDPGAGS